MTENKLRITYQQKDELWESAKERVRQSEAGDDVEPQDVRYVLNFEDFEDLALLMRRTNLELIEAIVSDRPTSIREAAELVDRDYRDVHRNLEELEELGVIEFETEGQGKRPILREGCRDVEFSFEIQRDTKTESERPTA